MGNGSSFKHTPAPPVRRSDPKPNPGEVNLAPRPSRKAFQHFGTEARFTLRWYLERKTKVWASGFRTTCGAVVAAGAASGRPHLTCPCSSFLGMCNADRAIHPKAGRIQGMHCHTEKGLHDENLPIHSYPLCPMTGVCHKHQVVVVGQGPSLDRGIVPMGRHTGAKTDRHSNSW